MEVVCKCGSKLFWESVYCWGIWERLVSSTGEVEDTNLDRLKYRPSPKTVICAQCHRRNPNPCIDAGTT